jgi:hypothetical protein
MKGKNVQNGKMKIEITIKFISLIQLMVYHINRD